MSTKIMDAVQSLNKITLNQQDLIGSGQYAEVYRYSIQNTPIAVQCFDNEEEAIKEMDVILKLQDIATDCPGIINYYGMKKLQIEINGRIGNQNYYGYVLFMEQYQADLRVIKNMQIKEIFNLLNQMSLALFCLHSYGYYHGDLKPANILVNNKNQQLYNYYLTNYGQGQSIEELITTNNETLKRNKKQNTRANFGQYNPLAAADIYALGIICIELLIGQYFIQKLNMARQSEQQYQKELENIKEQLLKIPEFKLTSTNSLLITLLQMVSFHQQERPLAIEICQALISSQFFSIEALEVNNMKALIIQLISFFNPIIKINNASNQKQQTTNQIQKDVQTIAIPTFQSDILKNSTYSSLILSLFDDSNIKLSKIHHQQLKKFNKDKFHNDCDNKGPTLVILHSSSEPNCFFGGMAVPSWQSPAKNCWESDPVDQSSWLFKIELEGEQLNLHQWKCIDKNYAIFCYKSNGTCFGAGGGGLYVYRSQISSQLPSNNEYYKKQDLTGKLHDQKNLLFQLNKTMNINCSSKVIGKIMNKDKMQFQFSECEVFTVQK